MIEIGIENFETSNRSISRFRTRVGSIHEDWWGDFIHPDFIVWILLYFKTPLSHTKTTSAQQVSDTRVDTRESYHYGLWTSRTNTHGYLLPISPYEYFPRSSLPLSTYLRPPLPAAPLPVSDFPVDKRVVSGKQVFVFYRRTHTLTFTGRRNPKGKVDASKKKKKKCLRPYTHKINIQGVRKTVDTYGKERRGSLGENFRVPRRISHSDELYARVELIVL